MEKPWTFPHDNDIHDGHNEIAHLIADITGRTIIIVETDIQHGGEEVYIYKPGFVAKFGILPSKCQLEKETVSFCIYDFLCRHSFFKFFFPCILNYLFFTVLT